MPSERAATVTAITEMGAEASDCAETIGTWLRAQRLARKWSVYEMARRLQRAARDDGGSTVGIEDIAQAASAGGAAGEVADLKRLAAGLAPRGCKTVLVTRDGGAPTLDVVNGEFPELSGQVRASAGHFWWSGAERIARCDDIPAAVLAIARDVRVSGDMR